MNIVCLDRHLAWRASLLMLLLAWPLILFGRPAYFSDALSYYKGGKVAVEFAVGKFTSLLNAATFKSATPSVTDARSAGAPPQEATGARSIPYSVVAYLLSAPNAQMFALVLAQAMAASLTMTIVVMALGATQTWKFVLLMVTIVVATPVACFVNLAVPDIFAGLIICIFALIATYISHLSRGVCIVLSMIGAFAVASHASHLPLAAGLVVLGLISIFLAPPMIGGRSRAIGWLITPFALGVAATVLSGFIGFGEVSLVPKRYPLVLARSVEDGPARWYLERNCATLRYAVCEVFGTNIPSNGPKFLWEEQGLRYRASPEQMERIRAEEQEVVLRATLAYPFAQLTRSLTNVTKQLLQFSLVGTHFDQILMLDAEGKPYLESTNEAPSRILMVVETLSNWLTIFCIGWVLWRFRALPGEARTILLLVIAGIGGNAIICAVFSAVADRYQARVIWILPMVSLALILGLRKVVHGSSAEGREARLPLPASWVS